MRNSLVNRLKRAVPELAAIRRDLFSLQRQQGLAARDAAYFAQQAERVGREVAFVEQVVGEMWLALLNSGLSHQRVLAIARSLDADTLVIHGERR